VYRVGGCRDGCLRVVWEIAVVIVLQRSLAILLSVVTYGFLLNVPHSPSTALGIAYSVSAMCLGVAAWRVLRPTLD